MTTVSLSSTLVTTLSVFVYGTLKPGLRYHYLAEQAGTFIKKEAYLDGFDLYHLEPENYPALVVGTGRVHGWRYTFEDVDAAIKILDKLEGLHLTPPEYERVKAVSQPGEKEVWVYLYCDLGRLETDSASLVSSGIWMPSRTPQVKLPRSLM